MEQMAPADAEKHFQEYAEFTADIKRNVTLSAPIG
jgi:hypothetical protein